MPRNISSRDVIEFKIELLNRNKLIREYLPEAERGPFFLLAATGLGKTIVIPTLLLEMAMRINESCDPVIWVVEPKVFIAQDLSRFLNELWFAYCEKRGIRRGPLFGCKTSVDRTNLTAPIVFCTTGIFSIYARSDRFRPGIDRILIDEAHDTLETDHAMELGVAISRQRGVRTDFMSATVDTDCIIKAFPDVKIIRADARRHAIWRHNTNLPIDECIVDVIRETLLEFNPKGVYAPPPNHPNGKGVTKALLENDRAKGALIIVTSVASQKSDAQRVYRLLKSAPYSDKIEIMIICGATRRDMALRKKFERDMERCMNEGKLYVVIATSVVEMGVTLPNLDVIVTMDQCMTNAEDGKGAVRRPLGTNALMQRAGRVGRERPGLLVITQDADAPYSSWDDAKLNADGALKPEPIQFPMSKGRLSWLAFHFLSEGWINNEEEYRERISKLSLPTNILSDLERLKSFGTEAWEIFKVKAATGSGLTGLGQKLTRWIGRFEIAHSASIIQAYEKSDGVALILGMARCAIAKSKETMQENDFEERTVASIFSRYQPGKTGPSRSLYAKEWQDQDAENDTNENDINRRSATTLFDTIEELVEILGNCARAEGIESQNASLLEKFKRRQLLKRHNHRRSFRKQVSN